jgi:hypothetical protein
MMIMMMLSISCVLFGILALDNLIMFNEPPEIPGFASVVPKAALGCCRCCQRRAASALDAWHAGRRRAVSSWVVGCWCCSSFKHI